MPMRQAKYLLSCLLQWMATLRHFCLHRKYFYYLQADFIQSISFF